MVVLCAWTTASPVLRTLMADVAVAVDEVTSEVVVVEDLIAVGAAADVVDSIEAAAVVAAEGSEAAIVVAVDEVALQPRPTEADSTISRAPR